MTTTQKPRLSVVIPAYREAGRIAASVREVLTFFDRRGVTCEVIVADDGSDDETASAVEAVAAAGSRVRLVSLGKHRGKGAAVRRGVAATTGERVLIVDADLAIPLEEYEAFGAVIDKGSDLAFASKELGRRRGLVRQPLLRTVMGRVFNLVVRALALPGVLDSQAGFKLMRGDAARSLAGECTVDGFAYDVEILALARLRKLRITELPVHCRLRRGTSVRVMCDSLDMLKDILRIRRRIRTMGEKKGASDA